MHVFSQKGLRHVDSYQTQDAFSFTQIFMIPLARSASVFRIATLQAMEPDVFLMRDFQQPGPAW